MSTSKRGKRTYGLLGKGIGYSLSPAMHNAAFRHFGAGAEYILFDVEEEALEGFFRKKLLGGKISGVNVTVPYKVRIKEMLGSEPSCSLGEDATAIGAVNTIEVSPGGLSGFNTDVRGFYDSLAEETGFDPAGGRVFVIGAGGAARAVCFALMTCGSSPAERISVFDVDASRASSLAGEMAGVFGPGVLRAVDEKEIPAAAAESALLVNATPMGTEKGDPYPGSPGLPEMLHPGMAVYDLVYRRQTELLKAARDKGLKAAGGLGMLVGQAALSFDIWVDENFYLGEIRQVMRKAAEKELKRREKEAD